MKYSPIKARATLKSRAQECHSTLKSGLLEGDRTTKPESFESHVAAKCHIFKVGISNIELPRTRLAKAITKTSPHTIIGRRLIHDIAREICPSEIKVAGLSLFKEFLLKLFSIFLWIVGVKYAQVLFRRNQLFATIVLKHLIRISPFACL